MEIERKYPMKLNVLKKIKLYHTNFRREHGIIYGFIYFVYMIGSIFLLIISLGYFLGIANFSTPEDAYEMFAYGAWYIVITVLIIPTICGLRKWKKYLFPGTYKDITDAMAKEILETEEFRYPIENSDEMEKEHSFLESENYFSFHGQLIPKSEIEEIDFDSGSSKNSNVYIFSIVLRNGASIKEIYREVVFLDLEDDEDHTVMKYLRDYLENSGYENSRRFRFRYKKKK